MLEAGSGRDQGHAAPSRIADGRERALHAAVRTPRRDPKTIVGAKLLLRLVSDHVRGNPFDAEPEMFDGTARQQEVSISGALRCWREPLAERAQVATALDR